MSILDRITLEVIRLAQAVTPAPYATIKIGSLPVNNGISMTPSGAVKIDRYIGKDASYRIVFVLNGKHSDQSLLSDTLGSIHEALTQMKSYPDVGVAKITDIETVTMPTPIDDDGGQFLYGSSLSISYYHKKTN